MIIKKRIYMTKNNLFKMYAALALLSMSLGSCMNTPDFGSGIKSEVEVPSGAVNYFENSMNFGYEGGDIVMSFKVNLKWEMKIAPTQNGVQWLTIDKTVGSSGSNKVTFTANDLSDKSVRVDFNGETQYFSGADLVLDDNQPGKASFTYSLYANQLKDTVRFTVCEGDDHTPISDTMTYSAASYAGKYINNPNFGPLLRAMMLYGKAAEEFAAA